MSQTAQTKPAGRGGQGRRDGPGGRGGQKVYGGGKPNSGQSRRPRREDEEEVWIPKTILGKKVASGEINSIEEIIQDGLRIQEAGIIKKLLPDLNADLRLVPFLLLRRFRF